MALVGITVRVWDKVADGFDRRASEIGLRRDAFLARVLRLEVPRLDAEVVTPVSAREAQLIKHQLKRLDTRLLTFRLPRDLVDALDAVCEAKNVVRDAFFNRLLFALCTTPSGFLSLSEVGLMDIARVLGDEGWETKGEEFQKGALDAAASVLNDPLWVIRACLDAASKAAGRETAYRFYDLALTLETVKGFEGLNIRYAEPEAEIDLDILLDRTEPAPKARTAKS